jgi:hypothetical protein
MAEKTTEKETAEKRKTDENVIYVGNKPPMRTSNELRSCSSNTV